MPIKSEELHHLNDRAMTVRMSANGIAKHLAGAQGASFLDVLAGDLAAAYYYEDLVLGSQFLEGLSVLTQARCVAACQDASRLKNRRIS
ncbi:MAG: hypothetical protein M0Q43_13425 [Methanothrix sp.]|nr:hypothetical protein [Methanothrix sp.]